MLLPMFKALADETRLRLLNLLSRGEFTVQELTEILAMGQSRISRHLKILHQAGLLAVRRQGTWSYYRLEPDGVWRKQLFDLLRPQLQKLATGPADLLRLSQQLERQKLASREFFDRHARQWDLLKQQVLPLVTYRPELLRMLGSGKLLVEVGIGTGELLPELAKGWGTILGVDQSRAMLEEAGRRTAAGTAGEIELRLGEMDALPIADARADAVLMNMVLHHALQPLRVLQEAIRVLVPGGRLVIADLVRHDQDWAREALADVWLGFTRDELSDWMDQVGLREIKIRLLPQQDQRYGILLAAGRKSATPQGDNQHE